MENIRYEEHIFFDFLDNYSLHCSTYCIRAVGCNFRVLRS